MLRRCGKGLSRFLFLSLFLFFFLVAEIRGRLLLRGLSGLSLLVLRLLRYPTRVTDSWYFLAQATMNRERAIRLIRRGLLSVPVACGEGVSVSRGKSFITCLNQWGMRYSQFLLKSLDLSVLYFLAAPFFSFLFVVWWLRGGRKISLRVFSRLVLLYLLLCKRQSIWERFQVYFR